MTGLHIETPSVGQNLSLRFSFRPSRYLIISQQIMGGVPPIVFVRDRRLAAIAEVRLLSSVFISGLSHHVQHGKPTLNY